MGRKRSRLALKMASLGLRPSFRSGLYGEVDHHDRVLLDDADQEEDADQRDDAEFDIEQHERQDGADAGRRKGREDREGMGVALVKDPQHNVDRDDGGQDEDRFVADGLLEGPGGSLEAAVDRGRHVDPADLPVDARRRRRSSEASGRQVEGDRRRRRTGPGGSPPAGVVPIPYWVKADSGTMVSRLVLTAWPVEAAPWPVAAMALRLALRAASAATDVAVAPRLRCADLHGSRDGVGRLRAGDRAPRGADVDVGSACGSCQYFGATTMTTWYWFRDW